MKSHSGFFLTNLFYGWDNSERSKYLLPGVSQFCPSHHMGLSYYFSSWPCEMFLWRMGEVYNSVIGFSPQSGSSHSQLGLNGMVSIRGESWVSLTCSPFAVGSKWGDAEPWRSWSTRGCLHPLGTGDGQGEKPSPALSVLAITSKNAFLFHMWVTL